LSIRERQKLTVRIAALSEPAFEALPVRRTIMDKIKAVKVRRKERRTGRRSLSSERSIFRD
jgi:hypothetical protein